MTDAIVACPDHGLSVAADGADGCPDCGAAVDPVLDGRRRRRLSRFLSGALRHFPDDVGLTLDPAGWTAWPDLVAAAARQYDWADERAVEAVVVTDPKGRFERRHHPRDGDATEIRAAYGHSVAIDLDADPGSADADADAGADADTGADAAALPETLYHGTAPRRLDPILAEGLKPMGRRLVHLSDTPETARTVGRRHTDDEPVVLAVDVRGLVAAGFTVRKRGVGTYTVERVPPRFLSRASTG
jgi:putative RNA 2'-phosphotransferase